MAKAYPDKVDASVGPSVNLRSLDALRGLLAVFVLGHHARWLLWTGYENWSRIPHPVWQKLLVYATSPLRFGHEAVMIFFVLSGFFIHLRVAEQMAAGKEAVMNTTTFFRRRAHRLVPPYLLALCVTVLLDTWGSHIYPALYQGRTGDALLDENFSQMGFTARSVVPALVMLPASLGERFGSDGPLWSLGYEVVYYLMYPVWLILRRRGWLAAYGIGGLILPAVALTLTRWGFLPLVLAHYPVWLAGAALAEAVQRPLPATWLRWVFLPAVLAVAFGLIVLHLPLPVLVVVYAAGGAAVVFWCALLPRSINAYSMHRAWEKIGLGSYTVYVVHFPVLALLSAALLRWYGHRPTSGWVALGGAGVASVFCWLCYRICERHFLHRKLPAPSSLPPKPSLTAPLRIPHGET